MSFDPSSIIVNPKVVELMQYARLNGKLKSLVPEHDNNCNTEIHVSPSPIVKNQKTDDQNIMEGNDVFVKDLADEGFSLIIGNCRNIFKKFLPLNMFYCPVIFQNLYQLYKNYPQHLLKLTTQYRVQNPFLKVQTILWT